MFLPRYRPFLIICLVLLDVLIARNIVLAKTSQNPNNVLGSRIRIIAKITPTPTNSPTPTLTPTLTPTPTPVPVTPTPTPVSQPNPTSTPAPVQGSGSLIDQLNAFRATHGLSAVQSDSNTCNFARIRAQEISTSFDHSGFESRINSHTLPYPSYHEVTENIAMTGNQNQVIQMWIDSPGHNANMQKDTPYVCIIGFGNYYAYEGWRP